MEDMEFSCPQSWIALPRRPLRATIVVPDEWNAVAALLDGTLNAVDCHCGGRHNLMCPWSPWIATRQPPSASPQVRRLPPWRTS